MAGKRRPLFGSMAPFDEAVASYPALKGLDVGVVNTPIPGDFRKLEFWPPAEPGDAQYPRPQGLPIGKPGVQVISPDTTPNDIAGDVVSHYLVNQDKSLNSMYRQFLSSFGTPQASARLKEDYQYSKQNEGETRPFNDWFTTTRAPDYFRGYVFKQWPEKSYSEMYSPEQRAILDQMSAYLSHTRGR